MMKTRTRRATHSQCGYSLVEVSVVLLLAAVGLYIALPAMSYSVDLTTQSTVLSTEGRAGLTTLVRLENELKRSTVDAVSSDSLAVVYRHPLDMNGDGSFVDSSGNITWGIRGSDGNIVGSTYRIAFVADRKISERKAGNDLNGDGDSDDQLTLGYLERTTALGTKERVTPNVVLVDTKAPKSDLNGDGVADPMFELDSSKVLIVRLLLLKRSIMQSGYSERRLFLENVGE